MKQLAILVLVLTSFTSVFAMSEKSDVTCSKINQGNADKVAVTSVEPAKQPASPVINK